MSQQPPGDYPPHQRGGPPPGWGPQQGWGSQQGAPQPPGWGAQGAPPPGYTAPGGAPPGGPGWPPQQPAQRGGNGRRVAVVAVVAVIGLVVVLQVTGVIGTSRSIDALSVGDCVQVPEDMAEVESVDTVSCDEPHGGEVFFVTDLPGDDDAPYPFISLEENAFEQCAPAFEAYTGLDYFDETASGDYDVAWLAPTRASWDDGDRGLTCIATAIDGSDLTGSVAR